MADPTPLSPVAQAVAWAYDNTPEKETGNHRYHWLAAALRAAAECSCEEQDEPPAGPYEQGYLDAIECVFKRLNTIAAELEVANG